MQEPSKNENGQNNSMFNFTANSRNESNLSLQSFQFKQNTINVILDQISNPWFVGKDICSVLKLGNPRTSLALLDDDEKDVYIMDTQGGKQRSTIINEPGLYSLILRSRKPEAKLFKRWITHEVLPTIRKTGSYQIKKPVNFNEVVQNCQYCTVIGYWKYHGASLTAHQAKMVSIFCDNLSRNLGYEPCKIQIENFGKVKAYHIDILELIFLEKNY